MLWQESVPGIGSRGQTELLFPIDQIADVGIVCSAGIIPEYEVHVIGHIVNIIDS